MGNYARRLLRQALLNPEVLLRQPKFWKTEVMDLLLQHVDELVCSTPEEALPLAQLAPALAQKLPESKDIFLTRSFALLGSAYRAVGDFQQALDSFSEAKTQSVEVLELADAYRREAYLQDELGQRDQAFELVNRAIEIYRLEGDLFDRNPLGWTLIARGYLFHQAGRNGEALVDLSAAVGLIDCRVDPKGYYGAIHNLSLLLVEEGTHHEVHTTLDQLHVASRHLVGHSQRHLAKYKLRWLQGLAYIRFGAVRKAESNFMTARKGFADVRAPLEFAVVSLDLAGIYFDERRWEKLREIALETFRICKGLSATREMLAALALWGRAVQEEQLTHELLRQARGKLLEAGSPAGFGQ